MADTFTGCKLQGVLGKFGHVELSDIRGFAEISGDRAISGSEWGNILLWEDGICVAEITRKGKTCHDGSIEQIVNDNGSILSVGLDGVIRVCRPIMIMITKRQIFGQIHFHVSKQFICKNCKHL